MKDITLRQWQVTAVDKLTTSSDNMMIQAATGAGKTFMVCEYLKQTDRRALIIVHNLRLLYQWEESLNDFGVDFTLFHGKQRDIPGTGVVLSTFQTLGSRIDELRGVEFDDIFADEAHRACAETYLDIYSIVPGARRVGITATPIAQQQDVMQDLYGDLMTTSNLQDLFDQDILVEPVLISPSSYFHSVKHRLKNAGDDYSSDSMGRIARYKGQDAYNCVQAYKDYVVGDENERTLVFATDVKHSTTIVKSFKLEGIEARSVVATTKMDERNEIFSDFKAGILKVIVSVEVLTEGFDERLAKHSIIARPTKSLSKGLQIFGRVMRSDPNKSECQIIDLAGVFLNVGLPTWDVDWNKVYNNTGRGFIDFEEMPDDILGFEDTGEFIQMACTTNREHGLYIASIHEGMQGERKYSKCPKCTVQETQAKLELLEEAFEHVEKAKSVWSQQVRMMKNIRTEAMELPKASIQYYIGSYPSRRKSAGTLNAIYTSLGRYPFGSTAGYGGYRPRDYDHDRCQQLFWDIKAFEEGNAEVTAQLRMFLKVYKELVGKDHQIPIRANALIFEKSADGYIRFKIKAEFIQAIKQIRSIRDTLRG